MRTLHSGVERVLIALLILLSAPPGCSRSAGEEAARAQREVQQWRRKYDELSSRNKQLQEQLASVQAELEARLAERDAQIEKLRAELAGQSREVQRLQDELARLRNAPPPRQRPPQPTAGELLAQLARPRRQLEELAAELFERGDYRPADAVLRGCVVLGSEEPTIYYRIGFCEAFAGRYEQAAEWYGRAIDALRKAQKADPVLLKKSLNNRGIALMKLGKSRAAAEDFRQAIAVDAAYAPSHFNLGVVYARELNRAKEAIEAFRKHIVYGGSRASTAREWIRHLQAQQAADADDGQPAGH